MPHPPPGSSQVRREDLNQIPVLETGMDETSPIEREMTDLPMVGDSNPDTEEGGGVSPREDTLGEEGTSDAVSPGLLYVAPTLPQYPNCR